MGISDETMSAGQCGLVDPTLLVIGGKVTGKCYKKVSLIGVG